MHPPVNAWPVWRATTARATRRAVDALRRLRSSRWTAVAAGVAASTALSVLALPPGDHGALAFVALVPLLLACRGFGVAGSAVTGWVFGVLSSLGIYQWLLEVPAIGALHMAVLAAYVALYPAAWCAQLPLWTRNRVPVALSAPAAWVLVEWARSHAGFLALPWATLAHTQHENLALLQLASVTGEAGVSFVVVLVNVALATAIAERRVRVLAVPALTVAALHAAGAMVLRPAHGVPITLAAVQPVVHIGERATPEQQAAIWRRLEALTLEAARARPAVIVWPETAVPDPALSGELAQRLRSLAARAGAPLVVGAAEVEKFATRTADGALVMRARETSNAAHLVAPGEWVAAEPYRKRILVPFAEYLPLEGVLDWPAWLVAPALASLQAGPADALKWTLPDGTRIAALICWENLFADLARDAVRGGAQVLVQLTNDAWFVRSAASRQHNLASVLRAVENRVPVVIASNTGPSQIVDAHGRVLARAEAPMSVGVVTAQAVRADSVSFYSRAGGWWIAVSFFVVVVAGASALRMRQCLGRSV